MTEIILVDLDSVEIVREVERAFHIKIGDSEATACQTMGDLFALVLRKIPITPRSTSPCPAAITFWKFRKALRQTPDGKSIKPQTLLTDVVPASRRRAWWQQLREATGMEVPAINPPRIARRAPIHFPGAVGLCTGVFAWIVGAGGWSFVIGAGTTCMTVLACGTSSPFGMNRVTTMGDLAKITAALNIGKVVEQTGSVRRSEAWEALECVVRRFTNYSGPIDKRTRFRVV